MQPIRLWKYLPRLPAMLSIACRPENGIYHMSFLHLFLVMRAHSPSIHLSGHCYAMPCQSAVQVSRKDRSDHTCAGSTTTKRATARPPPLPGINVMPGSYSSFTKKPPNS
jgi:hypothetical protein